MAGTRESAREGKKKESGHIGLCFGHERIKAGITVLRGQPSYRNKYHLFIG